MDKLPFSCCDNPHFYHPRYIHLGNDAEYSWGRQQRQPHGTSPPQKLSDGSQLWYWRDFVNEGFVSIGADKSYGESPSIVLLLFSRGRTKTHRSRRQIIDNTVVMIPILLDDAANSHKHHTPECSPKQNTTSLNNNNLHKLSKSCTNNCPNLVLVWINCKWISKPLFLDKFQEVISLIIYWLFSFNLWC